MSCITFTIKYKKFSNQIIILQYQLINMKLHVNVSYTCNIYNTCTCISHKIKFTWILYELFHKKTYEKNWVNLLNMHSKGCIAIYIMSNVTQMAQSRRGGFKYHFFVKEVAGHGICTHEASEEVSLWFLWETLLLTTVNISITCSSWACSRNTSTNSWIYQLPLSGSL